MDLTLGILFGSEAHLASPLATFAFGLLAGALISLLLFPWRLLSKNLAKPELGVTYVQAALTLAVAVPVVGGTLDLAKAIIVRTQMQNVAMDTAEKLSLTSRFWENMNGNVPSQDDLDAILAFAQAEVASASAISAGQGGNWGNEVTVSVDEIDGDQRTAQIGIQSIFSDTFGILGDFSIKTTAFARGENANIASMPSVANCFGQSPGDTTVETFENPSEPCPCPDNESNFLQNDGAGGCECREDFVDVGGECVCVQNGAEVVYVNGPNNYPIPTCECPECGPLRQANHHSLACVCECLPGLVEDGNGNCVCANSALEYDPVAQECVCPSSLPPCASGTVPAERDPDNNCECGCPENQDANGPFWAPPEVQFQYDETNGCQCNLSQDYCRNQYDPPGPKAYSFRYDPATYACECVPCKCYGDRTILPGGYCQSGSSPSTTGFGCDCDGAGAQNYADNISSDPEKVWDDRPDYHGMGCHFDTCDQVGNQTMPDEVNSKVSATECVCDIARAKAHCVDNLGKTVDNTNANHGPPFTNACDCGDACPNGQVPTGPPWTTATCACDPAPNCHANEIEFECQCLCPSSGPGSYGECFSVPNTSYRGHEDPTNPCECYCDPSAPNGGAAPDLALCGCNVPPNCGAGEVINQDCTGCMCDPATAAPHNPTDCGAVLGGPTTFNTTNCQCECSADRPIGSWPKQGGGTCNNACEPPPGWQYNSSCVLVVGEG